MATQKKSHTKTIFSILFIFITIAAGVIYFGQVRNLGQNPVPAQAQNPSQAQNNSQDISIDGTYFSQAIAIKNFKLSSTVKKTFTQKNLQGHWTFMFFGFTNCGMVCPTTMAELNKMYKTLQKEVKPSDIPQIVMVSVDPDRDSVQRMKEYVTAFNPHFIGARAEMPQIVSLEKELHLVAVKLKSGEGKNQYTINHSAEIMIFNPQGQLQAMLSYPHKGIEMAADYQKILGVTNEKNNA